MPLINKNKSKFCYLFVSLVMIIPMLACSLSDSVIEDAIARTEAAQPTLTISQTPSVIPTTPPTLIPTFTPVVETSATETLTAIEIESKFTTLSDALVSIQQLVVYFDENFKEGAPDFAALGLGNDCQIDCAGRWISGIFDTFDLIIELNQEASEADAKAAVEVIKSDPDIWDYSDYPPVDWNEFDLPTEWEAMLPDNYYSAYISQDTMVASFAVGSYGPVLIYITMLDYEMGWADYPNILLSLTTILQIMNLSEMQFE